MDPLLKYEAAQSKVSAVALTDDGDHKTFDSAHNYMSGFAGKTPTIRPNGVLSGGVGSPAVSGSNDVVDVSQVKLNLAGVETTVAAGTDKSITRGTVNNYTKHSVTINSSGAIAVVDGAEGTSHSDTRGANGGPPWIPTGSVELFQIHITDKTAAAISADEIKAVPGEHREKALSPTYQLRKFTVDGGALGYAGVTMDAALPLIHSDDAGSTTATKKIYAEYYTPSFADISRTKDFTRPANSKSVSSEEFYGVTIGKVTTSLGGGGFKVHAANLAEGVLAQEGNNIFFLFYPDRLNTDLFVICQGYLGVNETFETDGGITADCSINAEAAGERIIA